MPIVTPLPRLRSRPDAGPSRAALWTAIGAVAALLALGVVAPRFAGHAHARSAGTPDAVAPAGAATAALSGPDESVPPAAQVFANQAPHSAEEAPIGF
jgi:hypothetical protein